MDKSKSLSKNEERKFKTRECLKEAAVKVFVEKGYHATLISDIVAKACVGQGTFYRNFESKKEIFEILLDDFSKDLLSAFDEMTENLPSNLEEYEEYSYKAILAIGINIQSNIDAFFMFLREAPSIDDDLSIKLETIYNEFSKIAKFFLDHAIEHGFARPCNSTIVSQLVVGLGLRIISTWKDGYYKDLPLENIIEETINFALFGFGKKQK